MVSILGIPLGLFVALVVSFGAVFITVFWWRTRNNTGSYPVPDENILVISAPNLREQDVHVTIGARGGSTSQPTSSLSQFEISELTDVDQKIVEINDVIDALQKQKTESLTNIDQKIIEYKDVLDALLKKKGLILRPEPPIPATLVMARKDLAPKSLEIGPELKIVESSPEPSTPPGRKLTAYEKRRIIELRAKQEELRAEQKRITGE